MDNIYNYAKFLIYVWIHPKRVMVLGVTRKVILGLPVCILQVSVYHQIMHPKTKELWSMPFLKTTMNEKGLLLCEFMKKPHQFSLYEHRAHWMNK